MSFDEGLRFAQENNIDFMEVSAKTAYNVEEVSLIHIATVGVPESVAANLRESSEWDGGPEE